MGQRRKTHGLQDVYIGSSYSTEELELLRAVEAYKKKHRLKFLSYTQVLEVVKELGYCRESKTDLCARR